MTDQEKKCIHALAKMVEQYMEGSDGKVRHQYISAQEDVLEFLENLGWLRCDGYEVYSWQVRIGFDWEDTFDMIEKAK